MAQFGAPNFLQAINAYEQGSQQAERSRLRDLAEQGRVLQGKALTGDKNALAQLGQVDPQAYMQTQQFTTQQKAQRLDELASGAYAANTPEKWAAFVRQAAAQGHTLAPGETRDSILAQAMTLKDQLAQSNTDRSFNQQKSNSDRSYALDERQFNASQANADRSYQLQRAQLALKDPDLVELYDKATGQPYKARYNPKTGGYDQVGGIKTPGGNQLDVTLPDGTVISQGPSKITEGQGKDMGFLNRMATSMPTIDKYEGALTSLGQSVGGSVPIVGNYAKSAEYQQAEQAGNNFLTALLRKESGSAIGVKEQQNYGDIFLPRPGDKPPLIAQKREARRQAAIGIKLGLTAPLIKNMIQQGVDLSTLAPPGVGNDAGKSDQGTAPKIRTYNPATGELE